MSWSVYKTGMKDKVRAACEAEFDRQAKNYTGQEEEKDILAVKDRVLSAIDALNTEGDNGVKVEASGSRGSYSVTSKFDVTRMEFLI